jgi:hypothetical protein
MSIFETLGFSDLGIGPVQSEDEMTVVPIVGPSRGNIADPENLNFSRTAGYGTMVFENKDQSRPAIVPSNYMVRGKSAQDHAMAGSGVVPSRSTAEFDNSCCVESSQGGLLRGRDNDEDILPIELRKALLDPSVRSRRKYDKLWDRITSWLRGITPQAGRDRAHIGDFYNEPSIKKALEDFAAAFEPVENQIGAIIMFAGVPVGVEIMPSSQHWEAYWKYLIRGCYGAEMIRLKMLGKIRPSALILPEFPEGADPDKVEEILSEFSDHIQTEILPLLKDIQISSQELGQTGSLKTNLLHTDSGGGGDMIQEDETPVYLSLVL